MKKFVILLYLFLFPFSLLLAGKDKDERRFTFGVSAGINRSFPHSEESDAPFGLSGAFGTLYNLPVRFKLNDNLSLESGIGSFAEKLIFTYKDQFILKTVTRSLLIPIKLKTQINTGRTSGIYTSVGMAIRPNYFSGNIDFVTFDQYFYLEEKTNMKTTKMITIESGFFLTSGNNTQHEFGINLTLGTEGLVEGFAYERANPTERFNFFTKGTLLNFKYTIWFSRSEKN